MKKILPSMGRIISMASPIQGVFLLAILFSMSATIINFFNGTIIAYGDSESHLNIAKRVLHSPTPGFAQLGGIWLPLPHLLMLPFVAIDTLWRTGIAGSIVSGFFYIISSIFIFKLTYLLTKHTLASLLAACIFMVNANILYMQSTPMTELTLIGFFVLSIYFFTKFLLTEDDLSLVFAGLCGLGASLSRYDGWFLVLIEAAILLGYVIVTKNRRDELFGKLLLYATPAFFGIALWLIWDSLILGDPLYFSNSPFSAKSQQQGWLARGELPTYHNLPLSFLYYLGASIHNIGILLGGIATVSLLLFILDRNIPKRFFILLILFVPFIFYVVTLFIGQSVIFIPELVPKTFEWNLFNARYGIMMVAPMAILIGYLFSKKNPVVRIFIVLLLTFQTMLFVTGSQNTITLSDGTVGLSASKRVDAETFLTKNYDSGYILVDDYARTVSILRTEIPMQNVIYIGNKPFWEESLKAPEKYARWIVLQKDDAVWKNIYENREGQAKLFKYFNKVYTSPNILIFKKIDTTAQNT